VQGTLCSRGLAGLATTDQMLVIAKDLQTQYEKTLKSASIRRELYSHFRKYQCFYLVFCSKYGHPPTSKSLILTAAS
jgi:hypothetical protein